MQRLQTKHFNAGVRFQPQVGDTFDCFINQAYRLCYIRKIGRQLAHYEYDLPKRDSVKGVLRIDEQGYIKGYGKDD